MLRITAAYILLLLQVHPQVHQVVGEAFTVTSGTNCELAENGNCVQTSGFPTFEYFADETCTITVNNPGKIDVVVGFDVENDASCEYDYLTVHEKNVPKISTCTCSPG